MVAVVEVELVLGAALGREEYIVMVESWCTGELENWCAGVSKCRYWTIGCYIWWNDLPRVSVSKLFS
jgi:hypothetical protein